MVIKEIKIERYNERELDMIQLFLLTDLCRNASVDRIEYLVGLYNYGGNLEEAEKCFLINYVLTGRSKCGSDYKLYSVNGKKLILTLEQINERGYQVLLRPDTEEEYIKQIVAELKKNGFQVLSKVPDEIIAINRERKVIFYCSNVSQYYSDNYCLYRHPHQIRLIFDNKLHTIISGYKSFDRIPEEAVDFPLFYDDLAGYPYLSSRNDKDKPFVASMKRIAKYPELYELVGPENQKMIDELLKNHVNEAEKDDSVHKAKH